MWKSCLKEGGMKFGMFGTSWHDFLAMMECWTIVGLMGTIGNSYGMLQSLLITMFMTMQNLRHVGAL